MAKNKQNTAGMDKQKNKQVYKDIKHQNRTIFRTGDREKTPKSAPYAWDLQNFIV